MTESKFKDFSESLAKEITERSIISAKEISGLIEVRIKMSMKDFVSEYTTKAERDYLELLEKQSKLKVGSPQYNVNAYELTRLKAKKAEANRAKNNLQREDNYQKLKDYVIENYGRSVFDDFLHVCEQEKNQ